MYIKTIYQSETNNARKAIPMKLTKIADDGPYVDALSAGDIKIRKPGGSEANIAGTMTHMGDGDWLYYPTTGEVDTYGLGILKSVKATLYLDSVYFDVVAFNPYQGSNLGLTNIDDAISSRLAASSYQTVDTWLDAADTVETGLTLRGFLRGIGAAVAARNTGVGTNTEYFRAMVANHKVRLTVTLDANKNRSAITYDLT